MGFSMLSMLEIIYHATLRLYCRSYRKSFENNMSGHGDSDNNVSRQSWGNEIDYNYASGGGGDMHRYSSNGRNINTGFLLKAFQPSSISNAKSSVKLTDEFTTSRELGTLPEYFQTPFEADFYKAYLATISCQSPPLVDVDGDGKNMYH